MSGLNNTQKAKYNRDINNATNNTRLNAINTEARSSNNRALRAQQRAAGSGNTNMSNANNGNQRGVKRQRTN